MYAQVSCRVVTNNNNIYIWVARETAGGGGGGGGCVRISSSVEMDCRARTCEYTYTSASARAYTRVTWAVDMVARTPGPRGSRRNAADRPARNSLSSSCIGHVFVRHTTHTARTHTLTHTHSHTRTRPTPRGGPFAGRLRSAAAAAARHGRFFVDAATDRAQGHHRATSRPVSTNTAVACQTIIVIIIIVVWCLSVSVFFSPLPSRFYVYLFFFLNILSRTR